MPLPSETERLIQQGAFCNVAVYDADGNRQVVGLVTNYTSNEDFNVVSAQVIGHFGPVSVDSQNYTCNITIGAYVPLRPKDPVVVPYLDGGQTTLAEKIKTRSEIALTGKGTVFSQVDFFDRITGNVLDSFNHCVVTSVGRQVGANQYVTQNIQLLAIEKL